MKKVITLAELRKAAKRAFGPGGRVARSRGVFSSQAGEMLYAMQRHSHANYSCGTTLQVFHTTTPQIARGRLLRILTVLGNRRERRLRSGNVFCWSKP